jgi:hypothetical protein
MKILKDAAITAANLPKPAWIAAAIIPGGLVAVAIYSLTKAYQEKRKKK